MLQNYPRCHGEQRLSMTPRVLERRCSPWKFLWSRMTVNYKWQFLSLIMYRSIADLHKQKLWEEKRDILDALWTNFGSVSFPQCIVWSSTIYPINKNSKTTFFLYFFWEKLQNNLPEEALYNFPEIFFVSDVFWVTNKTRFKLPLAFSFNFVKTESTTCSTTVLNSKDSWLVNSEKAIDDTFLCSANQRHSAKALWSSAT